MGLSMDQVYFKLIKAGVRTIDTIPEKHREAVQALLNAELQAPEETAQ